MLALILCSIALIVPSLPVAVPLPLTLCQSPFKILAMSYVSVVGVVSGAGSGSVVGVGVVSGVVGVGSGSVVRGSEVGVSGVGVGVGSGSGVLGSSGVGVGVVCSDCGVGSGAGLLGVGVSKRGSYVSQEGLFGKLATSLLTLPPPPQPAKKHTNNAKTNNLLQDLNMLILIPPVVLPIKILLVRTHDTNL